MDKLKKILKKLKDEVLLYWKNEKNNIISFFGCLGFFIFVLGMGLLGFSYARAFFTILSTILGIQIMFAFEMGLEEYHHTQYPLLRKIKHGLIRSIVYSIILFFIGLLWYALLFD